MRQEFFLAFFRRLDHGQAYFQSRRTPAAVVKYRTIMYHSVVQLFDFGFAPTAAGREINLAQLSLAVDTKSVRRLADIAFLAAHQGEAEKWLLALALPNMAVFAFAPAAEAHAFLELFLFLGAANLAQALSHAQIGFWIAILSAFADPAE